MRLYVHALADTPIMSWEEDDGRRLASFEIAGIYVVAERRDDAPPATEAELLRQHSLVQRIAESAPAVIPARFGTLLEDTELTAVLRQRAETIATTFDHVRDRVQMTLRIAGEAGAAAAADRPADSGRDYLQRRREQLLPPVPPHAERTLRELRSLIVDERRKAERAMLSIYHLIAREDTVEYRETVTRIGATGVAVSGPFAPFAFAPELL